MLFFTVTLGDSTAPNEGRIDILHNETWGSFCANSWTLGAGQVACRELGFPGILGNINNHIEPPRENNARFKDISCDGSEPSLLSCHHALSTNHSCSPVGVVCEPGNVILYFMILVDCHNSRLA